MHNTYTHQISTFQHHLEIIMLMRVYECLAKITYCMFNQWRHRREGGNYPHLQILFWWKIFFTSENYHPKIQNLELKTLTLEEFRDRIENTSSQHPYLPLEFAAICCKLQPNLFNPRHDTASFNADLLKQITDTDEINTVQILATSGYRIHRCWFEVRFGWSRNVWTVWFQCSYCSVCSWISQTDGRQRTWLWACALQCLLQMSVKSETNKQTSSINISLFDIDWAMP